MVVAAAHTNWLPQSFGFLGYIGVNPISNDNSNNSDAPRNALIFSSLLSTFYIIFGNFRALLTFNGLGEYSFFFLASVAALTLRWKEPNLIRPFKTIILVPIIFTLACGFIVFRGALYAPLQGSVLISLWILGLGFYFVRLKLAGSAGH
jgi:L-type amino acid transporter 9